jgi:hypothetical protein
MKTAKSISRIAAPHLFIVLALSAATMAVIAPAANADPPDRVWVTGTADIHVWLDRPRDVYPGYDDVVISVQATRGCYATVFVVDTFGFIHVIHPYSPYHSAWMAGGVTYTFSGRALGLERLGGRGIVHVFAIASPYPFDYSPYGEAIFADGYGYRIVGDPYVACRELYVSLVPIPHRWDRVGIGFARFYVREWARYPAYLCFGYHGATARVRFGGCSGGCYTAYETYRVHVNNPRVVMREAPRYKDAHRDSYERTKIERATEVPKYKSSYDSNRSRTAVRPTTSKVKIVSSKRTDRTVTVRKVAAKQTKQTKQTQAIKTTTPTRSTQSTSKTTRSTVKTKDRGATKKVTNQKGKVSR